MKRHYLYFILVGFVSVSILWKSCTTKDLSKNSDSGNIASKRPRENLEPKSRLEEIRDFFQQADTRMDFYGRVVDQNGNGVEGVTIHYKARKAGNYLESGIIENTDKKSQAISKADGRFEIREEEGLTLSIGPLEKTAYRDGSKNPRDFGFKGAPEVHYSDPQNAVEFIVISSNVPKTRGIYNERLQFTWNQGAVRIPLTGKLGDIVLMPTRALEANQVRDFDWNVEISMEGSELASLSDDTAEIAPNHGYQKNFHYGSAHGASHWTGAIQARYAFRTSNGIFGKIIFELTARTPNGLPNGSLEVYLNESGSRNLD